jgi:Flp pilus assembly pilin Flp
LKSEEGATTVEYAILLALISMVCISSIAGTGSNANKTFSRVGSAVNVAS